MSGLTIWNLSYFPRGFLRDAVVQQHIGYRLPDAAWVNRAGQKEAGAAEAAVKEVSITDFLRERLFLRSVQGWPQLCQRLSIYLRRSMEDVNPLRSSKRLFAQSHRDPWFSMETFLIMFFIY